jgi:two-component system sensor histidine kinase SenX3
MDPAVVLLDADDVLVLANPAARALGIVRDTRLLVPELLQLALEVRTGGSRRRRGPGRRAAPPPDSRFRC